MKKISPFYVALAFAVVIVMAGFIDHDPADQEAQAAPGKNVAASGQIIRVSDAAPAATPPAGQPTGQPAISPGQLSPAVEAWITQNYGNSQQMHQALDQYAHAVVAFENAGTADQAKQLADSEGRAVDCVYFVARIITKQDTNLATNALDRVQALILDTPDAQARYRKVNDMLRNYIYPGVPFGQEHTTCDFPVQADGGNSAPAAPAS